MTRITVILCVAISFSLLAGCAARSNQSHLRTSAANADELSKPEPALPQLQKRIDVNYQNVKLVDVVDHLRQAAPVNFFINWAALEAAGVEQDLPITLKLQHLPVARVLELVLKQAGAGAELEPIGFKVKDGIALVSTLRDLQRESVVRVYDFRDMIAGRHFGYPSTSWKSLFPEIYPKGIDDSSDDVEWPTRQEIVEQIINLFQDNIGKGKEWAAYGGNVSSLRQFSTLHVIKTTPDQHAEIAQLFVGIRDHQNKTLRRIYREREIVDCLTRANTARLAGHLNDARTWTQRALDVQSDHPMAVAMQRAIEQWRRSVNEPK